MLDPLKERLAATLASQQVGIMSALGLNGPWSMPVRYRANWLTATCWVPSWSDLLYFLELDPRATLVVLTPSPGGSGWMQLSGVARAASDGEAAALGGSHGITPSLAPRHLYQIVHFTPTRIRHFDSLCGWGESESFDLA